MIDLSKVRNVTGELQEAEMQQLMLWAAERERLQRDDPLNYGYPPHKFQLEVHQSGADEILFIAANRLGKSVCGVREALWRATMTHPYKKVRPHDVIWCGFVDYAFYLKVTKRLFDEWVPKTHLIQFHESEKWALLKRKDGGTCTVYFLSYESGRMSWQGGGVDFIWLDEELPHEIYQEATARLVDRHGQMLLTQTPVTGLNWTYDEIYLPVQTGIRKKSKVVQGALALRDMSQPYAVGEPQVPHLTREQIIRLAMACKDDDERAIRVFGEFRGRSGGVFRAFDPTVHVVPAFKIPRFFEVWGGVDPGYHGFAALCCAMSPQGSIYVPLEFFSQQESHTERIRALWEKVQEVFELESDDWFVFYCDTANPQDVLELNIWAQEAHARLAFTSLDHGLKARETGISRVGEFLQPLPGRATPHDVMRPRPEKGEPMLYFFDTLASVWVENEDQIATSRLLWEMQRYQWRKPKKTEAHPTGADDRSAGGGHMMAALRYAIMARMAPPESPPESDPRAGWDQRVRAHMDAVDEKHAALLSSLENLPDLPWDG